MSGPADNQKGIPKGNDSPRDPAAVSLSWAKAVSRMGIAALFVLGAAYACRLFSPATWIRESGSAMEKVASAIHSGSVTHEFRESLGSVSGTTFLQVAALNNDEVFTHKETRDWYLLQPEVEIEIRVPVQYVYYLDLKDKWEFMWDSRANVVRVKAPAIEWNDPSLDTSKIKVYEINKSIFWDEDRIKDSLVKGIAEECKRRAPGKIPIVKELARSKTEEYVRNWIANTVAQDNQYQPAVEVVFADEVELVNESATLEGTDSPSSLEKP